MSVLPITEEEQLCHILYLVSRQLEVHSASQFVYFRHVLNLVFNVLKPPNLRILHMVFSECWERGEVHVFPCFSLLS